MSRLYIFADDPAKMGASFVSSGNMLETVLKKTFKWLLISAACLVILFAVLINLGRGLAPLLDKQRGFFEHWASVVLHQPVKIGYVKASWHDFEPQLQFQNVLVTNRAQTHSLIQIRQLTISIDWLHSLLQWKLLPGHLGIAGTSLSVQQDAKGHLLVYGLSQLQSKKKLTGSTNVKALLQWLLERADITVSDVDVLWRTPDGSAYPIKNIHIRVRNSSGQRVFAGVGVLSQAVPTSVKFIIHTTSAKIDKQGFSGHLYLKVHHVSLGQWANKPYIEPYLKGLSIHGGDADVSLWADWKQGRLMRLQSLLSVQQLHVSKTIKNVDKHLLLKKFSGHLLWQRYADGWGVVVNQMHVIFLKGAWPESWLGYRYHQASATKPAQMLLKLQFIRLQDLQMFVQDMVDWPKKIRQLYTQLKPRGDLTNIDIHYVPSAAPMQRLSVAADFNQLGISSYHHFPGFQGLSGSLLLTPTNGALNLRGNNAVFTVPGWFEKPFHWVSFNAGLQWRKNVKTNAWKVNIKKLQLNDGHLVLRGGGDIWLPQGAAPRVDLLMSLQLDNLHLLSAYLPEKHMDKALSDWLGHAFLQGQLLNGELLLRGPLAQFPFLHNQGHFSFQGTLHDAALRFSPKWPVIKNMNGPLTFNNQAMHVSFKDASIAGNPLTSVMGDIPDLRHAVLTVKSQTSTDLQHGFDLLHRSPLGFAKVLTDNVTATGPAQVTLSLTVPLQGKDIDVQARGSVAIKNAKLHDAHIGIDLLNLNGTLNFNNASLSGKQLTAQLYGKPVVLNVGDLIQNKRVQGTQILASGAFDVGALAERYSQPLLKSVTGTTQYQLSLNFYRDKAKQDALIIRSNLRGVQVQHFPPPYSKDATVLRPFRGQLLFGPAEQYTLNANYGWQASAAIQFKAANKGLQFVRGQIVLGRKAHATVPHAAGLNITGHFRWLSWAQWWPFLHQFFGSHFGENTASPALNSVDLTIHALQLRQRVIHRLHLILAPKLGYWQAKIQSQQMVGTLMIPSVAGQTWLGHFKRIVWQSVKKPKKLKKSLVSHLNPAALPPLNITVKSLQYNKANYGQVWLVTQPLKNGLHIKRFSIDAPQFSVRLSGDWTQQGKQQKSTVEGSFNSRNLSVLVNSLTTSPILSGGEGAANYALHWPAAPMNFSMATASGDVKVNFSRGRILDLGKKAESQLGLGRLLTIFSLQSLPSHLLSGLSFGKKGFEFSNLRGDIQLSHGQANIQNAYIHGPVASVQVQGKVGFLKKDYNLYMSIAPHITSSVPLIAGVIGGPIVGVVALVANEVIGSRIARAAGSTYHLSGTWKHPKMVKIGKYTVRPAPVTQINVRGSSK